MWQNGACYIRVSTDDQTEFSPDAQLRALKEYAHKNNIILSIEHIYIDEGISGKRADKRPEFMRMIASAKSKPKPFDVILVHKFDRFARSREDSVVYKSLLRKEAGVKVVSITETIEDDKFSVILEAMLEAMAEYYSLNLADEVKKGMTEKALRGEYQTTAPFGYVLINKQLVIEPKEAEFVKILFSNYSNNIMGLRQLASYANALGFHTKRGNLFEYRTVEYILNNPVYIGKVRWTPNRKTRRDYYNTNSIIANGIHEPIINTELWEKVHTVLEAQKILYSKRQKTTSQVRTWLKGLVRCSDCGSTLVWTGASYMQCNSYSKGACKVSHCIKAHTLETLVLQELKKAFPDSLEISIKPNPQDKGFLDESAFLNERLSNLDLKERRIKEAYQDGIDTIDEYKDNKKLLEFERKTVSNQLEKIRSNSLNSNFHDHIIKIIDNVCALFTDDSIDMNIKYKTAHFLINQVVFNKSEGVLEIEYK